MKWYGFFRVVRDIYFSKYIVLFRVIKSFERFILVDIIWNKCLLKWILFELGEKIIILVDIIWVRLFVVVVGVFLGGWRDLFFFCINFIIFVYIMIFFLIKLLLKNCFFVIGGL